MKKKNKLFCCIILTLVTGCKEDNETIRDQGTVYNPPPQPVVEEAPEPAPIKDETNDVEYFPLTDIDKFTKPGFSLLDRPIAHTQYLDDPVIWFEPDNPPSDNCAVVGNTTTVFYPGKKVTSTNDLENLGQGMPVPLSTVLPLSERTENSDDKYDGLFYFQNHYNYFYNTTYLGQNGIVFGADLYGIGEKANDNMISASLYAHNGRFESFPQFHGYRLLSSDEISRIENQRLAIQEVTHREYHLDIGNPDDMIALYKKSAQKNQNTLFLTTDFFAHSMHLFFDNYLQKIEEDLFFPRLKELIGLYGEEVKKAIEAADISNTSWNETLSFSLAYIQVAQALVDMAPDRITEKDEYDRDIPEYKNSDRDAIVSSYPENIQKELKLILDAEKRSISPNFLYDEDYSQYKPRGHYTKNGILEAYFRVMMWFGRIHFYISTGNDKPEMFVPGKEQYSALEMSTRLMPAAVFLTQITKDNPGIYESWKNIFDPVTRLIGMSDDLSYYDLVPFRETLNIEDIALWVKDEDNIIAAIEKANKELPPPKIAGNSVFQAPSADPEPGETNQYKRKPPMGWRLFGQRFTWDSWIHMQTSPPRFAPTNLQEYINRDFVRGLDIMKVFGSHTAEKLLEESDYKAPYLEPLKPVLDALEAEFSAFGSEFWKQTYYNQVLFSIKAQALFEQGSGFYFTETPSWGIKAMLSAHGTWTTLRHDTILYVKQTYGEAECAGGSYQPTYRTLPLPKPFHYIEPNVPFFAGLLESLINLNEIATEYRLRPKEFKNHFQVWNQLLQKTLDIVYQEYSDREVAEADIVWISRIPNLVAPLVVPPEAGYKSYTDNDDAFKGSIIADVYTNAQLSMALEEAIGIPCRIFVALNDGQGGKRIAVGYTFSYYEFTVPIQNRMTNEDWRELVYSYSPDFAGHGWGLQDTTEKHVWKGKEPGQLNDLLPFWMKGIALPPNGYHFQQ